VAAVPFRRRSSIPGTAPYSVPTPRRSDVTIAAALIDDVLYLYHWCRRREIWLGIPYFAVPRRRRCCRPCPRPRTTDRLGVLFS